MAKQQKNGARKSTCPFWEERRTTTRTSLKPGTWPPETVEVHIETLDLCYLGQTVTQDGSIIEQPFVFATYQDADNPDAIGMPLQQAVLKLVRLFRELEAVKEGELFAENKVLSEQLEAAMRDRE